MNFIENHKSLIDMSNGGLALDEYTLMNFKIYYG